MNTSGDGDGDDTHRPGPGDRPAVAPRPRERRLRTFDSIIDVPAFRWYMISQLGNQSAQRMQMIVRGYLAYTITDSFLALGFVELANSMPRMIFALYGGVLADRSSRRVIIQVGQAANALLAAALALLLFSDQLRFEHLLIGAVGQAVVNSFVQPARQSMIPEMVGRDRLMNAFALNALAQNGLRLIVPAVAGIVIATVGSGWVYVLIAACLVVASFTLFKIPKSDARSRAHEAAGLRAQSRLGEGGLGEGEPDDGVAGADGISGLAAMLDGLSYLRAHRILWILLGLQLVISVLSLPYQRLLPGFIDQVLSHGDDVLTASLLGWLNSFTAVGALVGSLLIASLPGHRRGYILIVSLLIFSVGLFAFSLSTVFWISSFIVVVLGVGQAGRQSLVQVLIQANVSDRYRGRISSMLLIQDGVESLGIFAIAVLAESVGSAMALAIVAVGLLALSLLMWSIRTIRELD